MVSPQVKPTVSFLSSECGLCHVGRALTSQPAVLSLSLESNLKPKVAFLHELGIEDLGAQLDAYPALLSLSLEKNLRPTAAAFAEAGLLCGERRRALRPRHLAASLSSRVLPRLAFCKARGHQPTLSGASTATDATFCKQVGEDPGSYSRFLAAWQRERQSAEPALQISWLPEGLDLATLLRDSG